MLSTSIHHRQTLTRRVVHHRLLFQLNTGNHHGDGGIASASKFFSSFWFSSSSSRSNNIMYRRHFHRPAAKMIFTIPTSTGASPIRQQHRQPLSLSFFPRRTNFSYAGPRKLSDILKSELLVNKSSAEISDVWMTYHENKEMVHGLILNESKGKSVLSRAALCPFFIHPIFREEGHFMLLSQFQSPNIFLLAFLEDYRMDPGAASPLLTISIFDDLAGSKGVTLVRCDIINRGISEEEGYKICKGLLEDYSEEDRFGEVHMFNKMPDKFDADKYVKEKERRWKE